MNFILIIRVNESVLKAVIGFQWFQWISGHMTIHIRFHEFNRVNFKLLWFARKKL